MERVKGHVLSLPLAILFAGLSGCAQPGPFAQRNALVGSLRESVSNLESQNQNLQRKLATLTTENRSLENRLVEEEAHSRDLAKRLNDARLASSRGEFEDTSSSNSDFPLGAASPRRARPTAQPGNRQAPFAQIHSALEPLQEERDRNPFDESPGGERSTPKRSRPTDDELFPIRNDQDLQSRRATADPRWLQIARTPTDNARR